MRVTLAMVATLAAASLACRNRDATREAACVLLRDRMLRQADDPGLGVSTDDIDPAQLQQILAQGKQETEKCRLHFVPACMAVADFDPDCFDEAGRVRRGARCAAQSAAISRALDARIDASLSP